MALVLEYERRRRYPILFFDKVGDSGIPVVCNVVASRGALAFALGVPERALAAEYARRIKDHLKPVVISDPAFRHRVVTGADVDLSALPIPTYFPGDAGAYLTAGMLVARDPDTGVETEGYHRFQVKGRNRMGVSLHSRRRMFEYQRRAEARGRRCRARWCSDCTRSSRWARSRTRPPTSASSRWSAASSASRCRWRRARPSISMCPPPPRSSSRARSCPASASRRARSASSPGTSRGGARSTSSSRAPSRCGSGRGFSRSARGGRAITSRRSAWFARPRS